MERQILWVVMVLIINGGLLASCRGNDTPNMGKHVTGANTTMNTYYMGRFRIDVPLEIKQAVQSHQFRYAALKEFTWSMAANRNTAREEVWKQKIKEVNELAKPRGKRNVIIRALHPGDSGNWQPGLLYYGNYVTSKEANWGIMIDAGDVGLWGEISGLIEHEDHMRRDLLEIMNAYHSNSSHSSAIPAHAGNWYYLKYGAINLPYLEQEKTYARFEGPEELKLEVEMNETHQVENLGMAERLAAALATRYAPGVDVDKIRSRSRTAAGLKGEELVMRMSARGEDTQLNFSWEYRGEVDSGERPEILITMETPDGNLDAKLKVWDRILDSFKPMNR